MPNANGPSTTLCQNCLPLTETLSEARQPRGLWRRLRNGLRPLWLGFEGLLAVPGASNMQTFRWGRIPEDDRGEPILVWEFPGWRLQLYGSPPPPELVALLPSLHQSLSRMLERLDLLTENRNLLDDVSFLARISSSVAVDSSIPELYRQALTALAERYRSLTGYGAFLEPGGQPVIQWDLGSLHPEGFHFRLDDGIGAQLALHSRQPVYGFIPVTFRCINFENGPTWTLPTLHRRLVTQARARSVAFVPVLAWSGLHGIIALYSRDPEFFRPTTCLVVEGIIAWLSSAVERTLHFEEEHRLGEGIGYLSTVTDSTRWSTFLGWCQEILTAAGIWLLWEDRNLGSDFWQLVAGNGATPELPELLPADLAEEYVRSSLAKKGLRAEVFPLERAGVVRGAWGWCRALNAPLATVPAWVYILTNHLALAVDNLERHLSLEAAVYRDQLTGLYNRAYLEEHLNERVKIQDPLIFALLDLDHFKELNDSQGHDAGDEVLRLVGARLWEGLRDRDLAVRLGGDEFVIILDGCPLEKAPEVLRRIVANLPLAENALGISAGVASWPGQAQSYEELYRAADQALYLAKKAGRNVLAVNGEAAIRPWIPTSPASGAAESGS